MGEQLPTARVRHINIHCHEPYELAGFWAALLGGSLHPDDQPGDPEALVEWGDGAPPLLFVHAATRAPTNGRIHLDVQPQASSRDEMVQRALSLGARRLSDQRRDDGSGWVVMADPEGNAFCIEMSAAEREQQH